MQPAPDSLERLVPDALDARDTTGRATLELHLARYDFATSHLRPGRALDMAKSEPHSTLHGGLAPVYYAYKMLLSLWAASSRPRGGATRKGTR